MTKLTGKAPRTIHLTAEEFLARERQDRRRTAAMLRQGHWRITSDPIAADAFWELFDAAVRPDGSIDLSVFHQSDDGAAITASFGPAMLAAAVGLTSLCLTAATAGYYVGKEIGEALDDDETETEPTNGGGSSTPGEGTGGEGSGGGASSERSRIVVDVRQDDLTLAVTDAPNVMRMRGMAAMTVEELLAELKRDRKATLRKLRKQRTRIVSSEYEQQDLAAAVSAAVRPDGSIDLAAMNGEASNGTASLGPMGAAIGVAMGAAVGAFLIGAAIGLAVETLGDDNNDDKGDTEDAPAEGDGGGDTSDTGEGPHARRALVPPPTHQPDDAVELVGILTPAGESVRMKVQEAE